MKILITGATGSIGSGCLRQCLSNPSITTVVAFVRRDLPPDVSNHPKLKCILMQEFSQWPDEILQAHSDAAGMIWAMGTYKGSRAVDLEYPLAFLEAMIRVLESAQARHKFNYVHVGGMFTRQDQEKKLCLLEFPRKLRGLAEMKVVEFANSHEELLKTFVVRPGWVVPHSLTGSQTIAAMLGENWCVRNEELGEFMAWLTIGGGGESTIIENDRIVRKGRELLKLHEASS
ncbi:hypothetical protein F4777DRAFT_451248 [Nemania sp. FL0916]|nr:hypothetical protein F4777DRAFT_451248 [Nemania sp. FL0916]